MKQYRIEEILTPDTIEMLKNIGSNFPDKMSDVVVALDRLIKNIRLELAVELEKDSAWDKNKIDKYTQNVDMLNVLFDFLIATTGKELVPIKGNKSLLYQEHTLNDIFTHKHFVKIQIGNTEIYVEENIDMLKKTCEYLINKDSDTFLKMVSSQSIRGRTSPYFSTDIKLLRRGAELKSIRGIYIETNHPADRVKQIIIALLQTYKIPLTEFKAYSINELQQNAVTLKQVKKKMKFAE